MVVPRPRYVRGCSEGSGRLASAPPDVGYIGYMGNTAGQGTCRSVTRPVTAVTSVPDALTAGLGRLHGSCKGRSPGQ